MALTTNIAAVLWDFGDTLCDERWMLAPLAGEPGWPDTYRHVLDADGLADRWNLGHVTSADVAAAFAAALGLPASKILAHMRACSRRIAFYPAVMALVASLRLPQAIVTINPDIFSEVTVPTYDLGMRFQAIVTSWREASLSKADLCAAAVARLPGALEPGQCLLVDNRLENVVEWQARGGLGLHFRDARSLADELATIIAA